MMKIWIRAYNGRVEKEWDICLQEFDRNTFLDEVDEAFEKEDIEEYYISDVDCEEFTKLINSNYTASILEFTKRVQSLKEAGIFELDEAFVDDVVWVNGFCSAEELKKACDNARVYDTINDFYYSQLDEAGVPDNFSTGAFIWLSEDTRFDFLKAQGFNVNRLIGGRCLVLND